ncbi:hypothetical protein BDN70DRAFT_888785, partial [Pholiota conissans]
LTTFFFFMIRGKPGAIPGPLKTATKNGAREKVKGITASTSAKNLCYIAYLRTHGFCSQPKTVGRASYLGISLTLGLECEEQVGETETGVESIPTIKLMLVQQLFPFHSVGILQLNLCSKKMSISAD